MLGGSKGELPELLFVAVDRDRCVGRFVGIDSDHDGHGGVAFRSLGGDRGGHS